ncbi:hypothetical protein DSCO28_69840 [Desulfosarcina ovata subsp. sediminis]|uniref:RNA polymerase sigma factor 70 region 4 type 2 domain-containing protein n=1 Tax=Desulfosarcina ovata subsp. sediminis TaxID=885957 RepID=A0A5K8A207_9BACT|nr:RNA polymerase sigma factor [Desulfosarcina ovata]BBO86418.1 hypothetical protein DSCO28_69840 [Desulfosarcina ovata subsp. sediminis]
MCIRGYTSVSQDEEADGQRSITQHDPTRPLGPWLARITYYECLKRLAKSQRIAQKEVTEDTQSSNHKDPGSSPEKMVGQRQVSETVDTALDRLTAQDRGMIVMRYREGFTDTEIAQAVSMPVGTVKNRLYRGQGPGSSVKRYLAPLFFAKGQNAYQRVVASLMRRSIVMIIVFMGLTALALVGFDSRPKGFVPNEDQGWAMYTIQLPDAASQQRTLAVVETVNQRLEKMPGIRNWVVVPGYIP